ncbi:fructose bisphosphate aldolase [Candidatus Saccharibacteria bacterium]|nr:fructose bisphosphate aldolase [Candidatus Saccharibacteria bacterium]
MEVAELDLIKKQERRNQQLATVKYNLGFIAALDQSGGSTPGALKRYGISESEYTNQDQMFDHIHEMRERIVTDPAFTDERVLGTILFRQTADRQFDGEDPVKYLWDKGIVSFLKIDNGLEEETNGVQLMKSIPDLNQTLAWAEDRGFFGTKERSVIKANNPDGIAAVLDQQFELARQVLVAGLVPILEPEVDINAPDKADIEIALKQGLLERLEKIDPATPVMLKLTPPNKDNLYRELTEHPSVLRVAALSGGYSHEESVRQLALNMGLIASFSRALTEGLNVNQTNDEFHKALDESIESIYQASIT